MAEFSISQDNFKNFISSLGKDLEDLKITVNTGVITASVGKTTHYIKRSMEVGVKQTGTINISDLTKGVCQCCKGWRNNNHSSVEDRYTTRLMWFV